MHALPFVLGAVVGWATAGRGTKTPDLRIWDVVALGPWLAVLALQRAPLTQQQRGLLLFTAAATITHNGRNYIEAARTRGHIG